MSSFSLMVQAASLVFALVIAYYSFHALNNCTRNTQWKVRIAVVITFAGACGVSLHILMGNVPHWSFAMMLAALALRLASDRRYPADKHSNSRIIQHP